MKKTKFKAGIIIAFLIVLSLTAHSLYRIISTTAPDFSVLWLAAKNLPKHQNPYLNQEIFTGVGYPANTLIFYLPLTLFSYGVAQTFFVLLCFVSIVGSVALSLKIIFKKISWPPLLLAISLTLLSFPTKFTLGMGQNNSIALFLLLLSYYFYRNKKTVLSGILLGTVIAFKTVFGFIFVFYVIKKEWKIVLYSILAILMSVFLVTTITDLPLYEYYINNVLPPLLNLQGREIYYNQGVIGFISRLTRNLTIRRYLGIASSFLIFFITAMATLIKKQSDLLFSLFIISLLLIDSLSWQHHFVWLIFPFIVLLDSALKKKDIKTIVLIAVAYFLASWNFKNPIRYSMFPLSLALSNTFYGAFILFLINIKMLLQTRKRVLIPPKTFRGK